MNPILPASLLLASVLATGCATENPAQPAQNTNDELSYRPGSHIPIRNSTPLTQDEKDKQAEDARKVLSSQPKGVVVR